MSDRKDMRRVILSGCVSGILVLVITGLVIISTVNAAGVKARRIRIDSDPAGAAVSSITGKLGVTPLTIGERDIYPNTYPDEKFDLYGKVVISKSGCKTVTRRITLDDSKKGLDVQLDCKVTVSRPASVSTNEPPLIYIPEETSGLPSEPLSDRRLRQLKVLNELLEDKLISEQEERLIRKRIFERLGP